MSGPGPWGLAGRVALVTGAGGGIGRAVVAALLAEGARVCAADLAAPEIDAHPGLLAATLDVTDPAAVEALAADAARRLGPIDLGVAVAGVLETGRAWELDDAAWNRSFAVNATGVFHLGRALAPRMIAAGRGAFVTVSSNAGGTPRQGMAAYAASKAAATMFTRCLGLELAPHGIRCNVVAPGSTRTPMLAAMLAGDPEGEARLVAGLPDAFKPGIPLGKLATAEDVADAVLFLLSDRAAHITMTETYVDGGASLHP